MKLFMVTGALAMALAVASGAMGAHFLKAHLTPVMMQTWNTAVEYHVYHGMGLLLVGVISLYFPVQAGVKWSGYFMIVGLFLFSGSLYLLAITGVRWLGAITPIGGISFILAWLLLAYSALHLTQTD